MVNTSKTQSEKPISELLEFSIIVLDKPAGLTSFSAINKIGEILNVKKVGHFGTLDPMVTGVLPFALNRACKLVEYFMHHNKEYVGKMYVHKKISKKKLEKEMKKFIGKIKQKPPVKSRVKRVERQRTINKFKIIKIEEKIISFHCDVEAGTYIRKLIHDLGENIGGAHMIELRRIRAGIFKENQAHSIEEIEKAFEKYEKGDENLLRKILIPAEIISEILPVVKIKEKNIKQLLNGKPLTKQDIENIKDIEELPNSGLFCAFIKNQFIGIYEKN